MTARYKKGKWYKFNPLYGYYQALPPEKKPVLLYCKRDTGDKNLRTNETRMLVGYLKFGGGDYQSPYFVQLAYGGTVIKWCDVDIEPERTNHMEKSFVQEAYSDSEQKQWKCPNCGHDEFYNKGLTKEWGQIILGECTSCKGQGYFYTFNEEYVNWVEK